MVGEKISQKKWRQPFLEGHRVLNKHLTPDPLNTPPLGEKWKQDDQQADINDLVLLCRDRPVWLRR